MFLHNLAGHYIARLCFIQQKARQAIDPLCWTLYSSCEQVQHFFDAIQAKIVEKTLFERCRRLDTQFRTNHRVESFTAHFEASLHLVLPHTGMPGTSI